MKTLRAEHTKWGLERGMPESWDATGLVVAGFEGFLPLAGVSLAVIPSVRGVYVVMRPAMLDPGFLLASLGRNLKSYTVAELQTRWVPDVDVVYIGKAAGATGLRGRLHPFSRMASNHSGGRSIWQLSNPQSLIVAWKPTIDEAPSAVEDHLHCAFYLQHGKLPYANISLTRYAQTLIANARR
jgi:hypothetical protein